MNLCGVDVGIERPLFLIAGPCVVESEALQMEVAGRLKEITAALGIPFIFKSSYRQGQPLERRVIPRPGARQRSGDPGEGAARTRACRC